MGMKRERQQPSLRSGECLPAHMHMPLREMAGVDGGGGGVGGASPSPPHRILAAHLVFFKGNFWGLSPCGRSQSVFCGSASLVAVACSPAGGIIAGCC